VILCVQIGQLSEVAQLRWDGASELIHWEVAEGATMKFKIRSLDLNICGSERTDGQAE